MAEYKVLEMINYSYCKLFFIVNIVHIFSYSYLKIKRLICFSYDLIFI